MQRGGSSQTRSGSEGRFSRRAEDPLAELARLIGQDDPFTEMGGEQQRPSRSHATPVARRAGNGNGASRPAYDDDGYEIEDRYDEAPNYDRPSQPAYARQYDDEADFDAPKSRRAPAPANGRGAYSYGGAPAGRDEPPLARPSRPAPRNAPPPDFEDGYDDQPYERTARNGHDASYRQTRAPQNQKPYEDVRYDQDYAPEHEPEYAEDDYAQEYAETPPNNRRRYMLIGVMSLIGVIVLGIAGVYGYRALFKKKASANPPTIQSSEKPVKVEPSAPAGGSKQDYTRIDEQQPIGGERVVSREEQPNLNPAGRGSVSGFAAPPGQAAPAPVMNPSSMGNLNQASGEPKRVRTMTVRSDGSVVDSPRGAKSAAPRANAPLALSPNAQPEPQDDQPQPAARPGPRSAAPAYNQYASTEPPARAQPTNYAPAGSYVVQVSSQKNEQDAHTAWRQLQAKYTNVLGNAQVNFKRVDLGDRGTFYRAMVGPFANRDQAYEMCQNLKTAGGECVVQRN
jgi:cell division septation protein DedD